MKLMPPENLRVTPLDYDFLALLAAAINIAAAIWNVRQGRNARRNAVGAGGSGLRARIR
jgi:hypothetical protein